MPPRRGGALPGPSPGPQDAYSVQHLFPMLLTAAVKLDPAIARLDPQRLRRAFHNKWTVRPPPPGDIEAASAILLAAARQVVHTAQSDDDPFEAAPQVSPSPSARASSRGGSPAPAGLPDITFPHIDPADIMASTSSSVVPPSVKSLLLALLNKDQEDLQALNDESMSLLRDLAGRLFHFLQRTPAGTPSGSCGGATRGTDYQASVASPEATSLSHTTSSPCAKTPSGLQCRIYTQAVLCQGCCLCPGCSRGCSPCPEGPRTPIQDCRLAQVMHPTRYEGHEGHHPLSHSLDSTER